MSIDNKDNTTKEYSQTEVVSNVIKNQENTPDNLQIPTLEDEIVQSIPEKTPLQQELLKNQPLLTKIQDRFPFAKTPEFQSWIEEYLNKDPFLTSAFLEDILLDSEKDFPYSSDGNLGPLGQKKRYWDWDAFKEVLKALKVSNISDPNLYNQEFSRCFDAWRTAWIEHSRGFRNDERVLQKLQQVFSRYPDEIYRKQIEPAAKEEWESQGTLTFEVFLDDIAKDKSLLESKVQTFSDIYTQWEQQKIQKLWKRNLWIAQFESTLKLAESNNAALKEKAEKEIQDLRKKSLSREQMQSKIEEIYNKHLQLAVDSYGMLNREEVIKTAFVGLREKDYQNGGLFLKKIQVIGKYYYNNEKISIDGIWWPQTEAVLLSLRDKVAFKEHRATIDKVLKANKSYGEKAKKLSQQLIENQVPGLFDQVSQSQQKPSQKSTWYAWSLSEGQKSDFVDIHINKHLEQSLQELSDEDIDLSLPRQTYLEAIKTFLSAQQLPDSLKFDTWLAEKILDHTGSGEAFDNILKLRESSKTKQELLMQQKLNIQNTITQQAGISAINISKTLFQKLWVDISFTEIKKNQQGKEYFECKDRHDRTYIFVPSTGEISLQTFWGVNTQAKKIDLTTTKDLLLAKIPTYTELINQAVDVNAYFPRERLSTQAEVNAALQVGIQDKITYQMGAVETVTIQESLEKSQKQEDIILLARKILKLDQQKELSLEGNRAFYEILVPIFSTLKIAKNTDLTEIQTFLQTIVAYTAYDAYSWREKDPKEHDDNPILSILSNPAIQKELQEKGNSVSKSEFALWILIQALEKIPEGSQGNLENKVLDLEKIKFLNHTVWKEQLEKNKQFWSRYQQTTNKIKLNYNTIVEYQDKLKCEVECKTIEQEIAQLPQIN